ncbi:unnamed protein product [Amoebophrya sp. A25]|nr:unnamed protein product [Amoebophrya sp. A25]|eukprot:GSA25T00025059001.1
MSSVLLRQGSASSGASSSTGGRFRTRIAVDADHGTSQYGFAPGDPSGGAEDNYKHERRDESIFHYVVNFTGVVKTDLFFGPGRGGSHEEGEERAPGKDAELDSRSASDIERTTTQGRGRAGRADDQDRHNRNNYSNPGRNNKGAQDYTSASRGNRDLLQEMKSKNASKHDPWLFTIKLNILAQHPNQTKNEQSVVKIEAVRLEKDTDTKTKEVALLSFAEEQPPSSRGPLILRAALPWSRICTKFGLSSMSKSPSDFVQQDLDGILQRLVDTARIVRKNKLRTTVATLSKQQTATTSKSSTSTGLQPAGEAVLESVDGHQQVASSTSPTLDTTTARVNNYIALSHAARSKKSQSRGFSTSTAGSSGVGKAARSQHLQNLESAKNSAVGEQVAAGMSTNLGGGGDHQSDELTAAGISSFSGNDFWRLKFFAKKPKNTVETSAAGQDHLTSDDTDTENRPPKQPWHKRVPYRNCGWMLPQRERMRRENRFRWLEDNRLEAAELKCEERKKRDIAFAKKLRRSSTGGSKKNTRAE